MTSDDRRKLDRDAAGCQPPAPVARPTPPAELPSRSWTEVKRDKWYRDLATRPRDVVARALHESWDKVGDQESIDAGYPAQPWAQLDDEYKAEYYKMADAALDAVAPLLRSPTFRSVTERRDAELRQALATVVQQNDQIDDLVTYQLRLEAQLQRYRESVRALARIVQRKRAGANRQVAYYKRLYLNTTELLRRRQS